MKSRWIVAALAAGIFVAGFVAGGAVQNAQVHAQASNRVFEMRTYTAAPGKFEALQARFRNHTVKYFEKHGMTNIGYWIPMDGPEAENTLVYILAHSSREAAKTSWAAFRADPGWQQAAKESEKDGRLLAKAPESVFLTAADYSPIK
jgi:hypothetical protein